MARAATPEAPARYRVRNAALANYGGKTVDAGQVISLAGLPNDEKLTRLGYVTAFDGRDTHTCPECGAEFSHPSYREAHYQHRHADPVAPWEPGQTIDEREFNRRQVAEERRADAVERSIQDEPLYLDKTIAGQRG